MAGGTSNANSIVCRRCKKSNLTSAIKCTKCDNCFHYSCAKHYINAKIIDEPNFTCCNSETSAKEDSEINSDFWAAINDITDQEKGVDIRIFNYIVKQKDVLIDELYGKIKLLNQQITDMKKSSAVVQKHEENNNKQEPENEKYTLPKIKNLTKEVNPNCKTHLPADHSNASGRSKAIPNQECTNIQADKTSANLNLNPISYGHKSEQKQIEENQKGHSVQNKNAWTEVTGRRHKKRNNAIVGQGNNSTDIKIAPKKAFLYVSRLDPKTSCAALEKYVKSITPEAKCELLNSKHPDHYSSFKVTIDLHNINKAMNSEAWVPGTYVSRFFHPRPTKPKET